MSTYLILAVACLLIRPLRALLLSWLLPAAAAKSGKVVEHDDDDDLAVAGQLAEISGGVWERLSVFEHIEQGLNKNPDGNAVICTFQAPGCLDDVLVKSSPASPTTTSSPKMHQYQTPSPWQQQQQQQQARPVTESNGALWKPQRNGSGSGGDLSPLVLNGASSHGGGYDNRNGFSLWQRQQHQTEKPQQQRDYQHQQNGFNGQSHSNGNSNGNGNAFTPSTSASGSPSLPCLTITYSTLHRTALRLAAGLSANGATPDSKLVMLIPNGGEFALLLWTCVLMRVTYVCLDPGASLDIAGFTALKHTLRALKPQVVVVPDPGSGKAVDVAVAELGLAPPVRVCLLRGSDSSSSGAAAAGAASSASSAPGWKSLADICADGASISANSVNDDGGSSVATALETAARRDKPTRVLSVMFTSGTSGAPPKGCPQRVSAMSHMLHSQSWLLSDGASAAALQQAHNSRGIAPAQTLQTWRAGGAVVMTGPGGFDAREAAAAVGDERLGVSFVVLTPPMVHEMAAQLGGHGQGHNAVRTVQVGGDAVTRDVLVRCAAVFPRARVCVNHGMTEGGGSFVWPFFASSVAEVPFFGEICPVGAVAPGSVVRVWDTDRKRVARRQQLGELHVSCESIIAHYLGGRSEASFYDDKKRNGGKRWFNTGDMAMVDREGLVFILGRRKDLIRRAGVAIMPAAIESSLEAFTGAQTVVVPAPHHVLGAEPFAVLSSYNGKTPAQIKDHVRAVFGKSYALGGTASLQELGLAAFPLNPTHKIIKDQVQAVVARYIKQAKEAASSKSVSVGAVVNGAGAIVVGR